MRQLARLHGSSRRRDWRFALLGASALLVMISYALPMFTMRIAHAETAFSSPTGAGTVIESDFDVLITGQHRVQAHAPLNEELVAVAIVVAPVDEHSGSGWAWMGQVAGRWGLVRRHASYLMSLLIPIAAAVLGLFLVALAWFGDRVVPAALVPAAINLTVLSCPALALAWLHQFDFSSALYALERGALAPRSGFWGAMVGSLLLATASLALRREPVVGRRPVRDAVSWWTLVFAVAVGIWLLIRFRPYPYLDIWNFVSDGILVTLRIVITSFGLILLVSLLGGLGRISHSRVIYGLASLYVEIIRGIPLLVQLLFIWFALPQVFDGLGEMLVSLGPSLEGTGRWLIDLRLSPFTAAVVGLTVCYGAYGSEIFRAGISSIHRGQMEAARSLGMNYFQAMRHVILPQAIRVILPPIGNEFVALLKDSTLVSVLAVSDLTRRGREYMARTFLSFDTWIMVALCYLVMTLFASRVVEYVESKTKF